MATDTPSSLAKSDTFRLLFTTNSPIRALNDFCGVPGLFWFM